MNKYLVGALIITIFNVATVFADETKDQASEMATQRAEVKSFFESQTLEDIQNMVQFDAKSLIDESAG